jgi:hypothetical protein
MAPKTAGKRAAEEVKKEQLKKAQEEDIFREPESCSDDDTKDDIIQGEYIRGSANLDGAIPQKEGKLSAKGVTRTDDSSGIGKGTKITKLPSSSSSSSIGSNSSTKRKSVEQTPKLEVGRTDVFGSVRHGKKAKKTYGSKPEVKFLVSKKKRKGFTSSGFPLGIAANNKKINSRSMTRWRKARKSRIHQSNSRLYPISKLLRKLLPNEQDLNPLLI